MRWPKVKFGRICYVAASSVRNYWLRLYVEGESTVNLHQQSDAAPQSAPVSELSVKWPILPIFAALIDGVVWSVLPTTSSLQFMDGVTSVR